MNMIYFLNKNFALSQNQFKLTEYSRYQILNLKLNLNEMPLNINKSITVFTILITLLAICNCSGILDFEYTEYTQGLIQDYHHQEDFKFDPVIIPAEKMQFPQACDLVGLLNEPLTKKQDHALSSDIDSYLNDMKSKFMKLLTLTQKLSNSEEKILHFQALINQTKPILPSESKISQLEKYEQRLTNLTLTILELDGWLRANLSQIDGKNNNHHIGDARRIEMDFKIDWLKEKISYLKNFEQRSRSIQQRSGPEIDYSKYFSDLEKQFNNEQGLISQIDIIIQKKDKLTQLRKEKINLESSISALDLYIKDIEECNAEKETIRKEFKNHDKINQLIHELKVLKKNEEPNIYCEGVVKKLTEKIRTMVRYYAIVASCASDLAPKMQDLRKEKEGLQEVDEKIAQLESIDNLEDFEKVYKGQKRIIESMYLKIKDWKMKQFVHNPEKIAEIRLTSELQLQEVSKQKSLFTEVTSGEPAQQRRTISTQIVEMIKRIRQLKYQYGVSYHEYDSLANGVWSQTYRYESEINLKNKLLKMYREERFAYEQMYRELIELRARIYESLS